MQKERICSQVFPGSELSAEDGWTEVGIIANSLQLYQKKKTLAIGCEFFADPGFYRISAYSSLLNFTVVNFLSITFYIANMKNEL